MLSGMSIAARRRVGGSGPPTDLVYRANAGANNTNNYTNSSVNFGAEGANRLILVVVTAGRASGSMSGIACTIAGTSATVAVEQYETGGSVDYCGIFYALRPTGTTGQSVNVTASATASGTSINIAVYAMYNYDSATPTGTFIDTTATGTNPYRFSVDVDAAAGGCTLGGFCVRYDGATYFDNVAWNSGLAAARNDGLAGVSRMSTHENFDSAQSGRTIAADVGSAWTFGPGAVLCAASWR